MRIAFADTVYWQALLDVRDDLHSAAESLAVKLIFDRVRIVTSEMVLTEVLNALGKSEKGRGLAVNLVESLMADRNVEIALNVECTFDAAFEFYKMRPDKQWGHTDCSSFIIMQQRGIQHALTHDNHFKQAGVTILL
jgi:predicted nucleic acid-binding protein